MEVFVNYYVDVFVLVCFDLKNGLKKLYFKNCFYIIRYYKNIFIKGNICSKYMFIYIENNKVMLKDEFNKIKIEYFYFSKFRCMLYIVILFRFENNIVFSYL